MSRRLLGPVLAAVALALATPAAHAVTIAEFPLAATPTGIALGPDGNLYVTTETPSILRVSPDGQVTARYPLDAKQQTATATEPVFSGGSLWYIMDRSTDGTSLGRRAPDGTLTEFPLPPATTLAPDAGGGVWFATQSTIGHVNAAGQADGTFSNVGSPRSLAPGADGRPWVGGYDVSGHLTPTGQIVAPGLDSVGETVATSPTSPTVWFLGRDGLCCYGPTYVDYVAWLAPDGTSAKFTVGWLADAASQDIAIGPDDNLWATDAPATGQGKLRIGRVTPGGRATAFTAGLEPGAVPTAITRGPGDTMWFIDVTGRAGRVTLDRPTTTTEPATDVGQTAATVAALVTPRGTEARVRFVYGTTTGYGTPTRWQESGDGDAPVRGFARLEGLAPGTTYHYRAEISTAFGVVGGPDRTFTTLSPPPPPPVPPADVDGDGYAQAVDCDDRAASVYPGAVEVVGNGIDEDCSGADEPYPRFFPHVTADFRNKKGEWSRARTFTVDAVPAGAGVALACRGKGCTFASWSTTLKRDVDELDLLKRLRASSLKRGAVLELRLTLPGQIGTVIRWTVGPPPRPVVTCLPPGATKDRRC